MMASSDFNDKALKLLAELYSKANDTEETDRILTEFRIITREKSLNQDVINERCLTTLIEYANHCHLEAQKCLSNLILNYEFVRDKIIEPYIECLKKRLKYINDQSLEISKYSTSKERFHEVLYYDLRIVFLLSALCQNSRNTIYNELIEPLLVFTSREADDFSQENCLIIIEAVKTLFNLTLNNSSTDPIMLGLIMKLFSIAETDKDVTSEKPDSDRLLVKVVHLLTNMPQNVYETLSDENANKVLNLLDHQLKVYSKQELRENVLPIINVCANICKFNEQVRLRWYQDIIESSKEFDKRPEEYETLRGRLVKLMTSVDVHIKDIAADFVYNLCGKHTEKFITYTGLGNSAAYVTTRGLLAGHSQQSSREDQNYEELRDKINPITGRIEEEHPNPMDGMSEEEKEYLAHQLADAITKLSNLGVVKPMQMDEDGRMRDLRPKE